MDDATADLQQAIAVSPAPADEFEQLSRRRQRELFFQLPVGVQQALVADMATDQLQRFVRHLDPDEATDVLGLVDEETRDEVLTRLGEDRREKIEFLLEFSPESAAGLMHLDYVRVDRDRSLDDVAERVQRHEERTGTFPVIFVTDGDEFLGELPAQTLALADRDVDLAEHVSETPFVTPDTPDTEVIDLFRANSERSIAVLDDDQSVLGVIPAEDLLRVIEEEVGRDAVRVHRRPGGGERP
ncbi:MAG: CBS domain-containing protein [Halobacteriales archaeon]|nr:CBS domain-containing protein [Halobacteriales archaeon]